MRISDCRSDVCSSDLGLDYVPQGQDLGPSATDRQHVGREVRLRRGIAPELVEHDLSRGVALEIDDDAYPFATGFAADVRDAFNPLILGSLRDLDRKSTRLNSSH